MRFNLKAGAEAWADIEPRKSESESNRVPFTYRDSGEARRFTTWALPEFSPDDVNSEWVLQSSLHINYINGASWDKALALITKVSGTERGFSVEPKSDKVVILHVYRPLNGHTSTIKGGGDDNLS